MIFNVILVGFLGLAIGSFLNVVIARYPEMLRRRWRQECREFLELPAQPPQPAFNLAAPRSQCPHCRRSLPFWQNIPLVSYCVLRGRCRFCRQPISVQYPLIELITALATIAVFFQFGWHFKTAAAWLMTWGLIGLSGIDWKTHLLPDDITLSLLWIGLIINIGALFTPLTGAVSGAVSGYLLLWMVAALFKIIRKKPGMGNGDFKMLAMLGAWLGVTAALYALIIAVLLSLAVNLLLWLFKKIHFAQPLPFGPWLAVAGWCMLMFGYE